MELIFIILFGTPQLSQYTCTPKQLEKASEVFIPCQGELHFNECYEASIRDYCEWSLR
jgi:hypothetical protein